MFLQIFNWSARSFQKAYSEDAIADMNLHYQQLLPFLKLAMNDAAEENVSMHQRSGGNTKKIHFLI